MRLLHENGNGRPVPVFSVLRFGKGGKADMRRCWYTLFLAVSLLVSALLAKETTIFGKNEETSGVQTVTDRTERTEETVEEEEQDTTVENEENGLQNPNESAVAEDVPLFPENFQGVLFIGDSRTVGLYEYGQIGEADVFADNGMSVFNLWSSKTTCGGERKTLEQLLGENSYQTIHFMLGINELGYSMEDIVKQYGEAVEKVQEMQPQARIVLGANLHVTGGQSAESDIYNNQRIDELNEKIEEIGREKGCYYFDVNEKFDDESGSLSEEYSVDGSHVLGKYYADWLCWLQEKE